MAAQPQEIFTPGLTPEQWAGLARLGDLAHEAEQFMGSPAGNMPMELALRAGTWNERYDLDGTLEELLETVKVLRENGILKMIRENAAFVTESIALITPLIPSLLESLRRMPVADMVSALQTFGDILPRLNALIAFLDGPAGDAATAKIKALGDLWQETGADDTVVEALRLLKRLHDDGNLQRIADISRQIGLFAETVDLEKLMGQFIQQSKDSPLPNAVAGLLHSGKLVAEALADAAEHESQSRAGGISGLYHMLKDPDVQRGMRVVAVLPVYMERAGILPKIAGK